MENKKGVQRVAPRADEATGGAVEDMHYREELPSTPPNNGTNELLKP